MSVGRISTYALHQATLNNASKVQYTLAEEQIQLSSGDKAQDFAGLGGSDSEQFLSLEGKINKTAVYQDNNNLISTRLNSTDTILSQVIDTANTLKSLISTRRTGTSDSAAFGPQLTSAWQALVGELNTSLQGRSLFAGTKTDGLAVDPNNFPTVNADGTPNTSYYLGNDQNTTATIDDNVNMTYNVRADDPSIQQIMAGLALAKQGDANNDTADGGKLAQAYDMITNGLNGVISAQSIVNQNKVALTDVGTRQSAFTTYWQGVKDDIGNTDIISVSTQVATNQGILQAAFQTFAKINALSLADYLK